MENQPNSLPQTNYLLRIVVIIAMSFYVAVIAASNIF